MACSSSDRDPGRASYLFVHSLARCRSGVSHAPARRGRRPEEPPVQSAFSKASKKVWKAGVLSGAEERHRWQPALPRKPAGLHCSPGCLPASDHSRSPLLDYGAGLSNKGRRPACVCGCERLRAKGARDSVSRPTRSHRRKSRGSGRARQHWANVGSGWISISNNCQHSRSEPLISSASSLSLTDRASC
jgi:hypothetical protein